MIQQIHFSMTNMRILIIQVMGNGDYFAFFGAVRFNNSERSRMKLFTEAYTSVY